MKSAWLKDTLREIGKSFNRFFSIVAIVALGVGFYVGVKATCPDMKLTADQYYQSHQLMDIQLAVHHGLQRQGPWRESRRSRGIRL